MLLGAWRLTSRRFQLSASVAYPGVVGIGLVAVWWATKGCCVGGSIMQVHMRRWRGGTILQERMRSWRLKLLQSQAFQKY